MLPSTGGTAVDTVAYKNLTPGVEHRLSGELMRKSDGRPTGIVGSAVFTPSTADGSVRVTFAVPEGYAGQSLVAFEWLFESGKHAPVAEHTDLDDAGQTVTVEREQKTAVKPGNEQEPGEEKRSERLPDTGGAAVPGGILIAAAASLLLGIGAIAAGRRARRRL